MQKFIEVTKIIRANQKDDRGNEIKGPKGEPIKAPPKQVTEVIRLDEIKSIRKWHKSHKEKEEFPNGDLILIYMKGDKIKQAQGNTAQILIYEDFGSFAERAGVITLKAV